MIRYLKNDEIDRVRWDECIASIPGVKPYGFSWYLDIITPGWHALVNDDYETVFPIPGFKKYGIKYVTTPVFLQRLGLFSGGRSNPGNIDEFLERIPDFYKLIDMGVCQSVKSEGFIVTERANYELELSSSYDMIWQNFSSGCKKNIEKSFRRNPGLVNDATPEELISLFRNNKGREIRRIRVEDYNKLGKLMSYCITNKKGKIIGARSEDGKLIFGRFVLETAGTVTVLFTANTPESRVRLTGYYVINELIKEYSPTCTILDFEGSSIPSIASFDESFGCRNVPFYRIYRNRLPWPVRLFK